MQKIKAQKNYLTPCSAELYKPMLEFLDLCFQKKPNHFGRYMGHIFSPAPAMMRNNFLFLEDGKIIGLIGVYPFSLRIGTVILRVGGIGSVAVHPEHRGRGIMSMMLCEAEKIMVEREYDISWLSGDRFRYRHYDWDFGGKQVHFDFYRKDLDSILNEIPMINVKPASDTDIVLLSKIYKQLPSGVVRTRTYWKQLLLRNKFTVYIHRSIKGAAYCIAGTIKPELIAEIHGQPKAALELMRWYCHAKNQNTLSVHFPVDDMLTPFFAQHASDFSYHHVFQMRYLDAESIWEKVVPEIVSRVDSEIRVKIKTALAKVKSISDKKLILQRTMGFIDDFPALPKHLKSMSIIPKLNWWFSEADKV